MIDVQDLREELQSVQDHIDQIKQQIPGVSLRDVRNDLLKRKRSLEASIRKLAKPGAPSSRPADAEGWPIPSSAYVLLERELAFVMQIEAHPKHGHVLHVLTEDGKRRTVRASTVLLVSATDKRVQRNVNLRAMIKAHGPKAEKE